MKRDMDLIRAILFKIEESPGGFVTGPIAIDGYDDETIGYHLHLMVEGHLLHGTNTTAYGDRTPRAVASWITWDGHNFIDAARSETVWNRTKAAIGKLGGASMTVWIETLTKVALEYIKP